MTVTVGTDEPVITEASAKGDIASWINFSSTSFEVSRNSPYKLKITVQPPPDLENGDYTGYIRVITGGLGKLGENQAGSVVRAAVDIVTTVTITDVEVKACRARSFSVNSVEKGDPIEFRLNVMNDGNIKIKPLVTIDIWDQERENIVKMIEFDDEEILPTTSKDLKISVPSDDFDIGQYWADIVVDECGGAGDTLTFDVMEKGSLRADGVLRSLSSKVWTTIGENVPIYAIFQNTGQKEVSAKFKGKIQRGETIVKVLESEELEVPVGETMNFTMFFKPEEAGRHVISGRVFYDKKRTYEVSSIVNVLPPEKKKISARYVVYLVIIIIIIFLMWKIRRSNAKKKQAD
ncbi:hypothetical protein FJZ53_07290 [Candidatus Woesearchaeota archaeon]|nr:hypothetical protein [Candidatus Woesearchaeota archaeon]